MTRRRSKNYMRKIALVDKSREYDSLTAIAKIKDLSYSSFEGRVELHVNLNVDIKKSEQRIRTILNLPHSTGKKIKILAFAKGEAAKKAKQAGADIVGDKDLIEKIEKGFMDFSVAVTTPEMMPQIVKIARILGPRGKMPNPKTGTVSEDIAETILRLKKGQVTLRTEKEPVIHTVAGKVSQDEKEIRENIEAVFAAINAARPKGVKGELIKSAYLCATVSPSIKLKVH